MTEGKATASNRRSAWGRYLLLFFVAAWMFVLGILVGRGTAPVKFDTADLQKELVDLRDAMLKKERETLVRTIRGEDEAEKEALEFYEALRKDEPEINDQIRPVVPETEPPETEPPETQGEKPPHKSRGALMAKRKGVRVKPAASTPGKPEKPPAAPAEKKTAQVKKTTPPKGRISIQVAALRDGSAAERIIANLKKEGYPAYLVREAVAGQGLWFKVRVGHYPDRKTAATDMNRLTRAKKKPIIVEN